MTEHAYLDVLLNFPPFFFLFPTVFLLRQSLGVSDYISNANMTTFFFLGKPKIGNVVTV